MTKEMILETIHSISERLELDRLGSIQMSDTERAGYEDDLRALRELYKAWDKPIPPGVSIYD